MAPHALIKTIAPNVSVGMLQAMPPALRPITMCPPPPPRPAVPMGYNHSAPLYVSPQVQCRPGPQCVAGPPGNVPIHVQGPLSHPMQMRVPPPTISQPPPASKVSLPNTLQASPREPAKQPMNVSEAVDQMAQVVLSIEDFLDAEETCWRQDEKQEEQVVALDDPADDAVPLERISTSTDAQSMEIRVDEARFMLDKLTPTTFDHVSHHFIDQNLHESKELAAAVLGFMFEKAVEQPELCVTLADVCKKLVEAEASLKLKAKPLSHLLRKRAKIAFVRVFSSRSESKALEEDLLLETNSRMIAEKTERLREVQIQTKRKLSRMTSFIAELYVRDLIGEALVQRCSDYLARMFEETKDDDYIESAVEMTLRIVSVYKSPERTKTSKGGTQSCAIEEIIRHLMQIKDNVSSRVQGMVTDLNAFVI